MDRHKFFILSFLTSVLMHLWGRWHYCYRFYTRLHWSNLLPRETQGDFLPSTIPKRSFHNVNIVFLMWVSNRYYDFKEYLIFVYRFVILYSMIYLNITTFWIATDTINNFYHIQYFHDTKLEKMEIWYCHACWLRIYIPSQCDKIRTDSN